MKYWVYHEGKWNKIHSNNKKHLEEIYDQCYYEMVVKRETTWE